MYEKTNCVLMVQRYKQWPSTTNLFCEAPRFFNKILQEGTVRTVPVVILGQEHLMLFFTPQGVVNMKEHFLLSKKH